MTEACADIGPQYFHGDGFADAVFLDFGAMHLGDRCRSNRWAEVFKHPRYGPVECRNDHGFGLCLREGRQAILKILKVARHGHADHVGAGGEELTEFNVSRTEARQRARQAAARGGSTPFDQPRHADGELRLWRQRRGISEAEDALAREHVEGACESRGMNECRDHKRQPECSATMPPDMMSHLTRENPASRIISANALGLGNWRIDSTR